MVIRLCDSRPHQAFEQSEKIKKKKLFYLIVIAFLTTLAGVLKYDS